MSMIEKMCIQGIRSFGPDDKDRQVIQFFKPLTLILGPNGTGKTTIIECLKYMTTGDLPPNSTKNCAFIHDPKIAHEREVKGQIRLQIRDVTGKQVLITRSMVATQKVKKVEMKTLEGVITRLGPDGQKKSINSRCADMMREMVSSLGVSKAVLENVIFCHQEDANWPLSEGKPLKEKFDAIFASTRYTKVLETIRKLKQEQDGQIKLFKEELKYLKQHKDKSVQLHADLADLNIKYETSEANVLHIDDQLKPLHEKLQNLGMRLNDIYQIKSSMQNRETEKVQIEKTINDLLKNIENEFQGSTGDLKRMLNEFQEKVEERQDTLQQYERRREVINRELEKIGNHKSKVFVEVGKLEQEAETHKENVRKRDELIVQYASDYSFEGFNIRNISEDKYRNFFENMKDLLESKKLESKTIKAEFEDEEEKLQKKMDDLKENKTKLESTERIKKELMGKNNGEVRQINQKLSHMEASAGRLDTISRDLDRAERDLSSLETTVDLDSIKKEINDMDKRRRELDSKLSELNTELNKLTLESKTQTELDMLKKDKVSKEDNIRRLKAKHEDTIMYLLNEMPSTNLRGRLDAYIGEQSDSVKQCFSELQKAKQIITTREAEKTMIQQQLKQKEEELRNLEEKIFDVCGSQSYDDGYQNVQQKLTQAQESRGSLLGAEHFFKKYVTDLEKDAPCCPLCHRDFENEQDVRELILDLQDKLRMVPGKLNKSEKDLTDYQKKYDAMTQLKPLRENIVTLNDSTIPNFKTKLRKLNDEISKHREIIENKTEELSAKENDEAMSKNMQPDIVMMDRYQGEVRDLDRKITNMAAMLSGGDSGRTIKIVVDEKGELQHTLDNLNKTLDFKRQKLNDHSDQIQTLRTDVNEFRSQKLQITSELQQRVKLEETKTALNNDNQNLDADIREAREQIKPLERQIEKVKTQKDDVVKEKEDKVDVANQEVEFVKNNGNKVKTINADIKRYSQTGRAEKLDELREKQNEIVVEEKKKEVEQDELTRNINKLNEDLASQKVRERELNDNLHLRKKKAEVIKLDADIEEENKKLDGIDIDNIEVERRKLLKDEDNLKNEGHTAKGRLQGLKDQIHSAKKELQTDMFKDAKDKYRDKVIDMRTTELSNKDLEKYYKAMDRAIMNYHNQKMTEINKIIQELWRNTYKGNDIETIEIRSDDDDSAAMKARRNYNYRVVMVKGDAALDMRGRCSAGQKVLASLIIRLALAETFCINCGILALDEPTTNLDRENIEGLAYALVEIIKSRSIQRNFQLVVITHDEDFVELLGRSEYVEKFWKVRKNQHGCSNLFEAHVNDLHMGR